MKFSRLLNNICYYRYRGKSIVKKKKGWKYNRENETCTRDKDGWPTNSIHPENSDIEQGGCLHDKSSLLLSIYSIFGPRLDNGPILTRFTIKCLSLSLVDCTSCKNFRKRINCLWGRIMRKVRSIVFKFMSHGMSNLIVQRKYLTILLG